MVLESGSVFRKLGRKSCTRRKPSTPDPQCVSDVPSQLCIQVSRFVLMVDVLSLFIAWLKRQNPKPLKRKNAHNPKRRNPSYVNRPYVEEQGSFTSAKSQDRRIEGTLRFGVSE